MEHGLFCSINCNHEIFKYLLGNIVTNSSRELLYSKTLKFIPNINPMYFLAPFTTILNTSYNELIVFVI